MPQAVKEKPAVALAALDEGAIVYEEEAIFEAEVPAAAEGGMGEGYEEEEAEEEYDEVGLNNIMKGHKTCIW